MPSKKKTTSKKKTAVTTPVTRTTLVCFVRDHSGSMSHLTSSARDDFNKSLASLREQAKDNTILVSSTKIGVGLGGIERELTGVPISLVKDLASYDAVGGTPLFDGILDVINAMNVADRKVLDDPGTAFLVIITTDGDENASKQLGQATSEIKRLTATDKWTFAFRVPAGSKTAFCRRFGIPEGNVAEWELTDRGLAQATVQTNSSTQQYFATRAAGVTSTKSFFSNLTGVAKATVKAKLKDISNEVLTWSVDREGLVREFCERKSGKPFLKGAAFYQLTKTERRVQDYKTIIIRDKKTSEVFSGIEARNLLGLPHNGTVKIVPGNHGQYDVFVQSTSVNRKVSPGTQMIYWEKVGVPYVEGVSAPFDRT